MNRAARILTTAGAFVAAGVGATVLNHRVRDRRRLRRGEKVAFGSVHTPARQIRSHDGLDVNVEVDEIAPEDQPGDPVTVVFLHGWMCTLDTWHYQRLALRDDARLVFMDHRSHGGSARSAAKNSTFADLSKDLHAVLTEVVPDGPIILVGHSMGGMTIQQYAIDHPDPFSDRIRGVALLGTSAGRLMRSSPALKRLVPLLRLTRRAMDWGREFNSYSVMRRWALGPDAEPKYVDMVDEMILRAPSDVIFDFYENFVNLDLQAGHETIGKATTVVIGGTDDQLTPYSHSKRLARSIPGAELVTADHAGHMMMFEQHELVSEALADLIDQVRKDLTN